MIKTSSNVKNQLKCILIALGFFSLSRGLWYNFQSLWLQQNGLSIETISTVTSLSALGSVSLICIFFNYITKEKIKKFINVLLIIKMIVLSMLFCFNGTNLFLIIKLLIFLDIIVDTEISTSIYPLLTLFQKDNTLYGKKDLITSSFYDFGILFGALFLGVTIFDFQISFNLFLLLSIFTVAISFLLLQKVKVEVSQKQKKDNIFASIMRYIRKDKISKWFLIYNFVINMSFSMVTGLSMLLLTNVIHMTVNSAANYILIIGLIADIVGILILKKFTFKNNRLNILVKLGGRIIVYFLAFLFNNKVSYLLALSYTYLFSNSYSHVINAPIVNRIDSTYQLAFNNIINILTYSSKSVGIWICGLGFIYGIQYMFFIAAILAVIQMFLIMYVHRLYNLERKNQKVSSF